MSEHYGAIAFAEAVRDVQRDHGSHAFYERKRIQGAAVPGTDALTSDEKDYLAERDSFYLATVSETGWHDVQFRGGPPGFVKVVDDHTIGWADWLRALRSGRRTDAAWRIRCPPGLLVEGALDGFSGGIPPSFPSYPSLQQRFSRSTGPAKAIVSGCARRAAVRRSDRSTAAARLSPVHRQLVSMAACTATIVTALSVVPGFG